MLNRIGAACVLLFAASLSLPLGLTGADVQSTIAGPPKPTADIKSPDAVPGLFARIVIDSLYCEKETQWDHGTSQDEPYVVVLGIAGHRDPKSWVVGNPEIFSDVDSGNNRRFTRQERVVYEGVVPRDSYIGLGAVLWESDESSSNAVMKFANESARTLNDNISSSKGSVEDVLSIIATSFHTAVFSVMAALGGGGDDKIDENSASWKYDELKDLAAAHRHVARKMSFRGEGAKYWLRYHIEFDEDSTKQFPIKFKQWDDLAVGNVDRTAGDEIVTVSEEDGPGNNGRFCVYDGTGKTIRCFDAPYAPGDRIAVADTDGDGICEILTAAQTGGGIVRMYDGTGALRNRITAPFAKYDGFAAGDLNGDGKAEVLIARVSDRKVYVYSAADERKIDEFGLNWPFKGTGYASTDSRHDVFLAGDVWGDSKAEIVMIENKNGTSSVIRVYNGRGAEVRNFLTVGSLETTFTRYDGAALGDIYGDSRKELILAVTEDEKSYSYTTTIVDLVSGKAVGWRHWPWYLQYCKIAAGQVLPSAKAQIVVVNGTDKSVYVGR